MNTTAGISRRRHGQPAHTGARMVVSWPWWAVGRGKRAARRDWCDTSKMQIFPSVWVHPFGKSTLGLYILLLYIIIIITIIKLYYCHLSFFGIYFWDDLLRNSRQCMSFSGKWWYWSSIGLGFLRQFRNPDFCLCMLCGSVTCRKGSWGLGGDAGYVSWTCPICQQDSASIHFGWDTNRTIEC